MGSKNYKGTNTKSPTMHFIWQRCTALVLIPIFCWLLFSIVQFVHHSGSDDMVLFLAHPVNFTLIIVFVLASLYHGFLGMDDIMKDYISCGVLYKIIRKLLFVVCVFTCAVTVANLTFYHLLFRYFSGLK
ncbi:succinate dehydrogenase, hydrophobic membrane anchor protein [Candidatus Bandiella euplotis]|nr:succinate dehydrogenase, hydrophobic membrane anchor protein [Candidatus Bandiella woodruffii]